MGSNTSNNLEEYNLDMEDQSRQQKNNKFKWALYLIGSALVVALTIFLVLTFTPLAKNPTDSSQTPTSPLLRSPNLCDSCTTIPGIDFYTLCHSCYSATSKDVTLFCEPGDEMLITDVKIDGHKDASWFTMIYNECSAQLGGSESQGVCTFNFDEMTAPESAETNEALLSKRHHHDGIGVEYICLKNPSPELMLAAANPLIEEEDFPLLSMALVKCDHTKQMFEGWEKGKVCSADSFTISCSSGTNARPLVMKVKKHHDHHHHQPEPAGPVNPVLAQVGPGGHHGHHGHGHHGHHHHHNDKQAVEAANTQCSSNFQNGACTFALTDILTAAPAPGEQYEVVYMCSYSSDPEDANEHVEEYHEANEELYGETETEAEGEAPEGEYELEPEEPVLRRTRVDLDAYVQTFPILSSARVKCEKTSTMYEGWEKGKHCSETEFEVGCTGGHVKPLVMKVMPVSWETDKHTYDHETKKAWWVKSKALAQKSNELCAANYDATAKTCKITTAELGVTGNYELVYLCSYDAEETAEHVEEYHEEAAGEGELEAGEAPESEYEPGEAAEHPGALLLAMANPQDEQAQYPLLSAKHMHCGQSGESIAEGWTKGKICSLNDFHISCADPTAHPLILKVFPKHMCPFHNHMAPIFSPREFHMEKHHGHMLANAANKECMESYSEGSCSFSLQSMAATSGVQLKPNTEYHAIYLCGSFEQEAAEETEEIHEETNPQTEEDFPDPYAVDSEGQEIQPESTN